MQLLDTDAVARRFAENGIEIDREEIARLARNGAFPHSAVKKGGKWYISQAEIDEYISSNPISDQPTTQLIRNQKVFITDVATQLGISVDKVRELCKYGYFKGAYQLWDNGPWQITKDAVESLAKRVDNLERIPTTWDRVRYWFVRNKGKSIFAALIAVFGLIFGAISAGADLGGAREQFLRWGVLRAFPSAEEGETLIVVAAFYHSEGIADTAVHEEIRRAIVESASDLEISSLRVEILPIRLQSDESQKAIEVGDRYNASMVIWGEDTGVRITVNYKLLDPPVYANPEGTISEVLHTQIASPVTYAQFVVRDLPSQLTFLALFANAQVAYSLGNSRDAIEIIEEGINEIEIKDKPVEGIVHAYYELGHLYQYDPRPGPVSIIGISTSREDLYRALGYFTHVIRLAPNTYTSDGSVYYDRATIWAALGNWDRSLDDLVKHGSIHFENNTDVYAQAYYARAIMRLDQATISGSPEDLIDLFSGGLEDANKYVEFGGDATRCDLYLFRGLAYRWRADAYMDDESDKSVAFPTLKAIADYSAVLELEPKHCQKQEGVAYFLDIPSIYLARGTAYSDIRQYEQAIADYKYFMQLRPDLENQEDIQFLIKYLEYYLEGK